MCNGLCRRIKERFKGIRLNRKGLSSVSCNHCEVFFPITHLDTMYFNDEEIISLVLKFHGEQKLIKLRTTNKRYCFCCGKKLSTSFKGSGISHKRDLLEQIGVIKRY